MAQLKDLHIERKHWLYPSNLLSLSRLVLIPPGYLAIVRGQIYLALLLLFAVALTDILDGYLARRRGQISELGKILDPIADKLAIFAAIIALIVARRIPGWILLPVLVRDFLIIFGSLLLIRQRCLVPSSNWWGKLTTLSVGLVVLFYMLPVSSVVRWAGFLLMSVLVVLSLVSYAISFVVLWREPY